MSGSREQLLERALALSHRLLRLRSAEDVLAACCREAADLTGAVESVGCYAAPPQPWDRGLHLRAADGVEPLDAAATSAAFAVHRRLSAARSAITIRRAADTEPIFRGLAPRAGPDLAIHAVPIMHRTGRHVGELLLAVAPDRLGDAAGASGEIARLAGAGLENVQRVATAKRDQERLLLLAETTGEAVWDWNVETGELWWGGGIAQLIGSGAEPIHHRMEWKLGRTHPDDVSRVRSTLERALSSHDSSWTAEYRFRRADGGWAVVEDHGYFLREVSGSAYRVIGSMRDVTALRESSEALRRNEERLRSALEASDIGTYIWDIDSGELASDQRARRLFALAPGDRATLADHAERVHPDDVARWTAAMRDTAERGAELHLEYRVVWPDGTTRWVLDKGRSVRGADGRISYVPGARIDITARKDLEARSERERLRAIEANRSKDEFLAMLGHELRNPLSPMTTALFLLRSRGTASKEIDILERQVKHLTRLVDDLLDVSRIARGKVELRRQRLTIDDVVGRAVELASPLLEQRRHRLVLRVATHLAIEGDPARLAQVVSNLLTNAAKYSDPGSEIVVAAARAGDRVRLSVVDQGIGIETAMLDRVFDMFVQQRQTIDRSQGGLGLGLAIVKSLVELHGGTVSVSSTPGRGSEFVIELPVSSAPEATRDAERVPPQPSRARARVLVVDDNRDAADLLGEVVASLGYSVAIAHDGPSALRVAREIAPDLALLDIGLPVMDGYELGARLRSIEPWGSTLRLVAITGYGQDGDRRRSAEAGFVDHLVKPVDPIHLAAVLEGSAPRAERVI